MAFLRLSLALLVVFHHYGAYSVLNFGVGWVADVGFLMLAGYTASLMSWGTQNTNMQSYVTRRLGSILFPYYLWLALSILAVWLLGLDIMENCSLKPGTVLVNNLLIFPMVLSATDSSIAQCAYLPQGWFLGLLIPCYMIFTSFTERNSIRFFTAITLICFIPSLLGHFHVLDPRIYGLFHPFPGVAFFCLGAVIHISSAHGKQTNIFPVSLVAILGIIIYVAIKMEFPGENVSKEVLAGLLLTSAVIFMVGNKPYNAVELFVSRLAVGIYFSHYLIMTILTKTSLEGGIFIAAHLFLSGITGYSSLVLFKFLMNKKRLEIVLPTNEFSRSESICKRTAIKR